MNNEEKEREVASFKQSDAEMGTIDTAKFSVEGGNDQVSYSESSYQDNYIEQNDGEEDDFPDYDQEHKSENNPISEDDDLVMKQQSWHSFENTNSSKDVTNRQNGTNYIYIKSSETTPRKNNLKTKRIENIRTKDDNILFHYDADEKKVEANNTVNMLNTSGDVDGDDDDDDESFSHPGDYLESSSSSSSSVSDNLDKEMEEQKIIENEEMIRREMKPYSGDYADDESFSHPGDYDLEESSSSASDNLNKKLEKQKLTEGEKIIQNHEMILREIKPYSGDYADDESFSHPGDYDLNEEEELASDNLNKKLEKQKLTEEEKIIQNQEMITTEMKPYSGDYADDESFSHPGDYDPEEEGELSASSNSDKKLKDQKMMEEEIIQNHEILIKETKPYTGDYADDESFSHPGDYDLGEEESSASGNSDKKEKKQKMTEEAKIIQNHEIIIRETKPYSGDYDDDESFSHPGDYDDIDNNVNDNDDVSYDSDDTHSTMVQDNECKATRRFPGLTRSQIERLSLDEFRHWKSTGNINCQSRRRKHVQNNVSSLVSAMLDPSTEVITEQMKWRKHLLEEKEDMKNLFKALYILDTTNEYDHPLHALQEPELEAPIQEVTSESAALEEVKAHSEPVVRRPSLASRLFDSEPVVRRGSIGRRFLDLTSKNETEEEYNPPETDDDDDDTDTCRYSRSTASSFSVPIFRRREKSSSKSSSRQFIDLTEGSDEDEDENESEGRNNENNKKFLKRMKSWMSVASDNDIIIDDYSRNQTSDIASIATDDSPEEPAPILPDESKETETKNLEVEDSTVNDTACKYAYAWESADAALIQEVHEIANKLETMLNDQGLESPYWNADEIIPTFDGLHSQIKENMDRRSKKVSEVQTNDAWGIPMSVSFSIGETSNDDSFDQNPLHMDDLLGGYDDLGLRAIQRSDRAYLKKFFYDKKDHSFSLPAVLATGLDKRLSIETIETATDIIEDLTCPLRTRRQTEEKELFTIQEDDI